jgi:V8-like Glu-specific endopeptidase
MNDSVNMHTFEADSDVLLRASETIVFIVIEFEISEAHATGFVISERYIVTAGHCFYDANKRTDTIKRIQVTYPGLAKVDYFKLARGELYTVPYKLVDNLFDPHNPNPNHDIALLQGELYGSSKIKLSPELPPPDAVVDVIGYPGLSDAERYMAKKGYEVNDMERTLDNVRVLLPIRSLIVSRGPIASTGSVISYNASTVPGMSGSCVLYRGKVVGISSQ